MEAIKEGWRSVSGLTFGRAYFALVTLAAIFVETRAKSKCVRASSAKAQGIKPNVNTQISTC